MMLLTVQQHIQQQPQQDALAKFLQQQHTNQMHHQNQEQSHRSHQQNHQQQQQQQQLKFPFQALNDQHQPATDIQTMMRDVANGLLTHPQVIYLHK